MFEICKEIVRLIKLLDKQAEWYRGRDPVHYASCLEAKIELLGVLDILRRIPNAPDTEAPGREVEDPGATLPLQPGRR